MNEKKNILHRENESLENVSIFAAIFFFKFNLKNLCVSETARGTNFVCFFHVAHLQKAGFYRL